MLTARRCVRCVRAARLHSSLGNIGQPTPETHPQLMAAGEVTPGVSAREYAARRAALASSMPEGSVAVLLSAPPLRYHGTVIPVPSAYRQDSDLFYLTGVAQPECAAVLEKRGGGAHLTLLTPPVDSVDRTWHGPRVCASAGLHFFGADETANSEALGAVLDAALRTARGALLCDLPQPGTSVMHEALRCAGARLAAGSVSPLRPVVAKLRWRKSHAEQALMRASALAAAGGLAAAAGAARAGRTEAAPASAFEAFVRNAGAQRLAYPSVCGAGDAACAVHHGRYDGTLIGGQTMLMDAGCELHGYVSDVTRTWPLSRRFTRPQRLLYDAVRGAHRAALEAVRPGATLAQLHAASVEHLSRAISDLGLIPNASHAQVARGAYFRLYPHALGHFLGLDTHDTPSIPLSTPLQPGVVLTIEPGLYVWPDALDVPAEFRGLGVRIEDDVLVMHEGCEVLSAAAPVDAEEVEDWAEAARELCARRDALM